MLNRDLLVWSGWYVNIFSQNNCKSSQPVPINNSENYYIYIYFNDVLLFIRRDSINFNKIRNGSSSRFLVRLLAFVCQLIVLTCQRNNFCNTEYQITFSICLNWPLHEDMGSNLIKQQLIIFDVLRFLYLRYRFGIKIIKFNQKHLDLYSRIYLQRETNNCIR